MSAIARGRGSIRWVRSVVKEKYADSVFRGDGARQAGGRFNSPGRPVVYTSESLALAELEILVHLPTSRLLASYEAFRARLPDETVETLNRATLSSNWWESPVPRSVQSAGDAWLQSGNSLALRVPCAVATAEDNVLINPEPPHSGGIINSPLDPEIDGRLT